MSCIEFSLKTGDNVQLFAQEWHAVSAPKAVVVLIHGLGEHCNRYNHVAAAFNASNINVLALDLRGHGKSPGTRGHIPGYTVAAEDIDLLISEAVRRYPAAPVFLYGHSLGGALVLYYMLTHKSQLKGVIATSPGLVPANPPTGGTLLFAKVASKLAPSLVIDNSLDRTGLARDPQVEKIYSADPLVHGKISAKLGFDLIQNGQYILQHASEISLPLLLMVGSADRLVNPAAVSQLASLAPKNKITYKEWDGYYHELHNEPEKQEVIQFMLDWMMAHI